MHFSSVDAFVLEVETSLKTHFNGYKIVFLIRTPKSVKANIYLCETVFIAFRYNARNGRTDFALIQDDRRVFGYDNLKTWHCHPYINPTEHVTCSNPSTNKIMSDIKLVYNSLKFK